MKSRQTIKYLVAGLFIFLALAFAKRTFAQAVSAYSIKNGRMYIQVSKDITEAALDSFITDNELEDLDLKRFIKTNNSDSLQKSGWKVEINNESYFIISKVFEPFGNVGNNINNIVDRMFLQEKPNPLFPATNNGIVYGINKFRNKYSFRLEDSLVTFFLRNNKNANRVLLAGSFNNWKPDALSMKGTDSGWIAHVKLGPGKYWYKFIVDGNWTVDNDNEQKENDGLGNINSVFFRPNIEFTLNGFTNARRVFLAGSFNNWKPNDLAMMKTVTGWTLPLYLAEGTHTYKFVVDGKWMRDENNNKKLPDGHGDYNSVIRFGKTYHFKLNGYENAKQVTLSGSFNGWKQDELLMNKTFNGWEIPYALGAGNYEYKFIIDGKWITDPANSMSSPGSGNSFLIIDPNYTFRLKGFKDAKKVFLAGDFNSWDPKAYPMEKTGDDWVFPVHLTVGKHLYKFIVDDKWMNDPNNPLWEQNEYGTGNSILWVGR
ncbi:MAG TPA: glycogen-binding domain-containing protein [Flavisolibacter sp.]|nr:glycogen-binding domain-containing protein [Flavisolibacter sp.]